ncbi:unnamed protein product [Nezara viridula]|uniref:Neurotransmitter-gated ion-channel ligand-binding domain-containing protein n=1 Tax=Nezara viridula TaxID=85310 RepID=A0A9P0EA16_NEZVI|nr:unnamed protein product [Nezara viridula]
MVSRIIENRRFGPRWHKKICWRVLSCHHVGTYHKSLQGPHEKKLLNDLLSMDRYNTLERPVANESDPLEVRFGLTLQQIIDVGDGGAGAGLPLPPSPEETTHTEIRTKITNLTILPTDPLISPIRF